MAQPPAKISYINKSYEDERNALLARAPIVSHGTWTDLNNSELLLAFAELMLGSSDMIKFYMDHQANESFLQTARERKNVIANSNQLSHRMKSWSPASGYVSVKLTNKINGYISIPKYTKFWSRSGLPYFSTTEMFLSEGIPFADVPLLQGLVKTVTYTSTGEASQKFLINSALIGEGSITVSIDSILWECVDNNFILSGVGSQDYTLEILSNGNMYVVFGDGVFGAIPTTNASIIITWADTQGPLGNMDENLIVRFDEDPDNVAIQYSSNFSGGSVPETIEEAKKLAPMLLRSVWKADTKDDFAALTEDYPGVQQAGVLDINDFPLYSFRISYHEVWVVVIPSGGGTMSDSMRNAIYNYLEERKYTTCNLQVINAEYVSVDIDVTVYKKSNYDEQVIESAVTDAVTNLFIIATSPIAQYRMYGTVDGLVLGEDLRYSDVVTAINSLPGVSYIQMSSPTSDVMVNSQQIPILGNLTLNILNAVEVIE